MRVIAGRARGTKLFTLEGYSTRPTLDRLKEIIFSSIQYELRNRRVLDAFAGSGGLGIEALSRGAGSVDFVDSNPEACDIIKKNLQKTNFIDNSRLFKKDIFSFLIAETKGYDAVFIDPPYEKGLVDRVIKLLLDRKLLNDGAIVVVECERGLSLASDFKGLLLRKRNDYAHVSLIFFDYSDFNVLEDE